MAPKRKCALCHTPGQCSPEMHVDTLIVDSLTSFRQSSESKAFAKLAIGCLLEKLQAEPDQLDGLIQTITRKGSRRSKCATISPILDSRLCQLDKKEKDPRVVYARIWRWPDVQKNELKPARCCPSAFGKLDDVCVNPYHYVRVTLPPMRGFDSNLMYDLKCVPDDILIRIFKYLDLTRQRGLKRVDRRFKTLLSSWVIRQKIVVQLERRNRFATFVDDTPTIYSIICCAINRSVKSFILVDDNFPHVMFDEFVKICNVLQERTPKLNTLVIIKLAVCGPMNCFYPKTNRDSWNFRIEFRQCQLVKLTRCGSINGGHIYGPMAYVEKTQLPYGHGCLGSCLANLLNESCKPMPMDVSLHVKNRVLDGSSSDSTDIATDRSETSG